MRRVEGGRMKEEWKKHDTIKNDGRRIEEGIVEGLKNHPEGCKKDG